MDADKMDRIEEIEIAVQDGIEKAVVEVDGKKMSFIDGLKLLRTTYGVDNDELAKKATFTGNVIQTLGFFISQTCKPLEQRKAEKEAADLQAKEEIKDEFQQLLYQKELGTLYKEQKVRFTELKAALAPE